MTTKIFEFQFVGGGTYYWGTISTAQTPSVAVTISQQTGPDANNQYHFRGSLSSADSLSRYVGMIFDTIPIPVSSTISYLFEFDNYVMADSTSFSINWSFDKYLESGYGITPGSKVYLRAYALPRSGYYPSFNPATTKNEIYNPEVKFSNLDTLIAP